MWIAAAVFLVFAAAGLAAWRRLVVVRAEPDPDGLLVTVRQEPHTVLRWLGARPVERRFFGSGTVWHDADSGARASLETECLLADVYTLHERRRRMRA